MPEKLTDTPAFRKRLLQHLHEIDKWVKIDAIPIALPMPPYPRRILHWLSNLGLAEVVVVEEGDNVGDWARITPRGRRALASNRFTYKDWVVDHIKLDRDVYEDVLGLAEELGMDGLSGLVQAVLGRREAFSRWWRNISVDDMD